MALACGLYLFVGGVDSIRSRVLKVQLLGYALPTANLGLVVMLLFLPVRAWYQYLSGVIVSGSLGFLYAALTYAKEDLLSSL